MNKQVTQYLIGNNRIEADDLSLQDIASLLTTLKGVNYVYNGNNQEAYDWSFHYTYDNLMVEELLYQFGLEIKPLKETLVKTLNLKKGNPE